MSADDLLRELSKGDGELLASLGDIVNGLDQRQDAAKVNVELCILDAIVDAITRSNDRELMTLKASIECEIMRRNKIDEAYPPPADEWDPWGELRRRPWIRLAWRSLSHRDGTSMRGLITVNKRTGEAEIAIDAGRLLSDRARAETLTHELIHDERGVDHWTDEEREVEEREVRRLTRLRFAFYTVPSGWATLAKKHRAERGAS